MTEPVTPDREIREAIIEQGGEDAFKCYHCGKCASVCPWFHIAPVEFPVYRIPQEVKLGALDTERSDIWRCVGCEACLSQCPRGVNTPKILRAIRRILASYGALPDTLQSVIAAVSSSGNPFGLPEEKRAEWTQGLSVQTFTPDMEFLYFSCCMPAYDPILKRVAKATASVLAHCGVSFGILGEKEKCCCEFVRRAGAEEVFQTIASANIALFKEAGVKKVITTSPHCYVTFKKDYPALGAEFEVFHTTQIFAELLHKGKLKPIRELKKRVLYHDPCTLGRQSGIYDEPREVLKSIPGIELVEIPNFSREFSLCCGGGAALFVDIPISERLANLRVEQARRAGVDTIAVACPYCHQMFDEVVASTQDIEVKDISELLWSSISPEPASPQ